MARLMAGICLVSAVLAACGDGEDTSDCASGFKRCDGDCVADNLPEFGCADASCRPCALNHAQASCGDSGACSIAACEPGFGDCNNSAQDGCEVDVRSDVENCAIRTCATGFADEDDIRTNGCETEVEGSAGAGGAPGGAGASGAGGEHEAGGTNGAGGSP
ncbi:MAG TPA: hypothetical protein VM686_41410 [Polyangiaceae bacterium]|nr:hypothetical protein [Polyangiaceae bacterium]